MAGWRGGGVAHRGQCKPRFALQQREQPQLGVGALKAEAARCEEDEIGICEQRDRREDLRVVRVGLGLGLELGLGLGLWVRVRARVRLDAMTCEWPPLLPWTIAHPAASMHSAIQ